VVLDPGHGGDDSGAICGTVMEKDLTLDVAKRANRLLRVAGYRTLMTRESDRYVSLAARASLGNRNEHSIFISIHFNDDKKSAVTGIETYFSPNQSSRRWLLSWLPFLQQDPSGPVTAKSENLASYLQAALIGQTGAVNRGIKTEPFYVIANVGHPAALVEGGFITNQEELTRLTTPAYREKIAAAITKAVQDFRAAPRDGEATLALAATRPE
jgi:N-acetylmuramoyl-L-alanine amidase